MAREQASRCCRKYSHVNSRCRFRFDQYRVERFHKSGNIRLGDGKRWGEAPEVAIGIISNNEAFFQQGAIRRFDGKIRARIQLQSEQHAAPARFFNQGILLRQLFQSSQQVGPNRVAALDPVVFAQDRDHLFGNYTAQRIVLMRLSVMKTAVFQFFEISNFIAAALAGYPLPSPLPRQTTSG